MVLDTLGIASFLAMVAFLSVLVSNKSSYVTCLLVSRVYNFALRLLSVTTNDAVYIAKHFISLGLYVDDEIEKNFELHNIIWGTLLLARYHWYHVNVKKDCRQP